MLRKSPQTFALMMSKKPIPPNPRLVRAAERKLAGLATKPQRSPAAKPPAKKGLTK